MKITQISEHIWRLKIWIVIPIHIWIVADRDGVTLVDAGLSVMAKGILNFVDRLQAGPLKRILLTHGHSDHVGAIKRLLENSPVPVYAHASEIPYMEGDRPYSEHKKAAATIAKGIVHPLQMDENEQLQTIAGLKPYLTPGHSPGHVAYYHEKDDVLLAGDLFTSKNGKLRKPMAMFTADMHTAIQSSEILRKLKPKRLEICHGNEVIDPAAQLDDYLKKYKTTAG